MNFLLSAGEASGDNYGAQLVEALRQLQPGSAFFGMGGEKMRAAGCELLVNASDVAVVGLAEVVTHLPGIYMKFRGLVGEARKRRPDAAILIDFPDFNLRLARDLHNLEIPVFYFVSPQIWAWRSGRVKQIQRFVRKMIVIFPFEKQIYEKFNIDCDFVGHPFLEVTRPVLSLEDFRKKFDLGKNDVVVGLLPGSRRQEVEKILPVMLESCRLLKTRTKNLRLLLALAPTIKRKEIEDLLGQTKLEVEIVEDLTYDVMKHSHLLLIASGSATLECAILGTPFLVLYQTGFWTYVLAKSLITIPNVALANVVAGKRIVPEFIQKKAIPHRIADEMYDILNDKNRYKVMQDELQKVKGRLGEAGASKKAAQIVAEMLVSEPSAGQRTSSDR
jgi:lipid-A-disaccharide synthase